MAAHFVKIAEAEGAIHLGGIIAHIRILWGRAGPDLASAAVQRAAKVASHTV